MRKALITKQAKQPGNPKKFQGIVSDHILHHLAFDNSFQANIITIVSTGKIIIANNAACKLLGYSRRELLTKRRSSIFDIKESAFQNMLQRRTTEGHSKGLVTAIKKSGKLLPSEITSAVFMDEDGIEKAITTISDLSLSILRQKKIDAKKEKTVASDIKLAKTKQKVIDNKKNKLVAGNIMLAKSKQKEIDTRKEKLVAYNIDLVKSEQKVTDLKKNKIVADDISLAKSAQKEIDIQNEKIVADDIALAKSAQKEIDVQKEKIVADDIALAKSAQKEIDIQNEKIVADDIALAKSAQKEIDVQKEKIVAYDIALAKSAQKEIDVQKEKIVADNIIVALKKSDARLAENNEWVKYISKASYDVMWDWDIATGDIYVGDSIKEIFGYVVVNNTMKFSDVCECLLPGEKAVIEKKLLQTLASDAKIWMDSFKFRCKDGSVAGANSRASIMRNEGGKAIRLIGATQDASRLQELEKKLGEQVTLSEERDNIFHKASKLSFDGIWDWNILTNEFFLGEGFEELFGYSFNNTNNVAFDWSEHLHPDDKAAVEGGLLAAIESTAVHWEDAYRFIRADGSVAEVFGRASIIRDAAGKACRMIGVVHDLSRQNDLEEKLDHQIALKGKMLSAYSDSFKSMFNTSSDIFYDSDLLTNTFTINDAYEKEFGYPITANMTPAKDWIGHIHSEDREAVRNDYLRMVKSADTEWKYEYRFLRADSSVANVVISGIILRHTNRKAYRMMGYMHDTKKQKVLDEKLEQEIKLKEKQIAEAREDARDTERSDIGKELHDNVNQLLGASKLYLDLAKRGGENSEIYLRRSSEYTVTAIEEIRKLTKGLTTDIIADLGLADAIDNMARDTMEINTIKISHLMENFNEGNVNNKFKMNIYRIVQEQLNNIIKHAKATEVVIDLSQNKKSITLAVSDNGVGFDTRQRQKGIGLANIKSRATSYNGSAEFISQPGEGCVLKVIFPVTESLSKAN